MTSCVAPTPATPFIDTPTPDTFLLTATTLPATATSLPTTPTPTTSATPENAPAIRFPARDLIHDLQWSPDGSLLAISAGTDIHLYDWRSRANLAERHSLPLGLWAERIAFHPSQPILGAAAKDGSVRFWDTTTGAEICTFIAHRKGANSLAFQPGGTTPAGQPGGVVPPERHPAGTTPAGQPGGDLLATTGAEIISRLWDISSVTTGGCDVPEVASLIGSSYTAPDVTFSADGQMFALVDIKDVYLRESQTRKLIAVLESDLPVFDIALSPDGRWLAAAQNNATLTLWDLTAKPRPAPTSLHFPFSKLQTYVWRVDFSSDSRLLAGAASDGALLVWELPRLEAVQAVFSRSLAHALSGLAFKPSTHLLAAGSLDGVVYLYLVE